MQSAFLLMILHLITCTQLAGLAALSHESAKMLRKIREMFEFGYSNYMKYAYPKDELDPIHCCGRGHDFTDRSNINVNDALGDYQLTLVDSLDSLAVGSYSYQLLHRPRCLVTQLNSNELFSWLRKRCLSIPSQLYKYLKLT